METVSEIYQYITANIYLEFLLILVISLIVALLGRLIVRQVLKPLAKKTKTMIDDLIIRSIGSVIFYIILVLGFKVGFNALGIETELYHSLVDTFLVLMVMIALLKVALL